MYRVSSLDGNILAISYMKIAERNWDYFLFEMREKDRQISRKIFNINLRVYPPSRLKPDDNPSDFDRNRSPMRELSRGNFSPTAFASRARLGFTGARYREHYRGRSP